MAFAVGFAFTVSLGLAVLLAGSILSPLRELTKATRRVAADNLDERVPVTSTDETGELTESFNEMVKAVGERERLREAFGAFVDPNLTERVLEEGTDLEGEEVEVSILFLDVRDFTSFSEETDAHDVVAELNELFETAVPCVHDHGGHVDKFVGDGLIAVFGAPERMPDHAIRAVEAARSIAEKLGSASNTRLQVGVGVNTGRVIAGTVGGGGRLDFTVIGDAVNTAARVEALTRKTGEDVLITGATHAALDGAGAYWEELPEAELPGKREPVKVFAPRGGGLGSPRDISWLPGQPRLRSERHGKRAEELERARGRHHRRGARDREGDREGAGARGRTRRHRRHRRVARAEDRRGARRGRHAPTRST